MDRIFGDGGDDLIKTGLPDSVPTVHNDFASGGSGNDRIYGQSYGNAAHVETVFGGPGHDFIRTYYGDDIVYGGTGADDIDVGYGNDEAHGGAGNDTIIASLGGTTDANDLHGDAGNDYIEGNAGPDDLFGGPGDDRMFGKGGDDELNGEDGDDTMYGGTVTATTGVDVLKGGKGDDLMFAGDGTMEGTAFDGGSGLGIYMYGDEGDDEIWSSSGNLGEYLWGGEGNDLIYGAPSNEQSWIFGNQGHDTIFPGSYGTDSDATTTLFDSHIRAGKGNDVVNPVRVNEAGVSLVPATPNRIDTDATGFADFTELGGYQTTNFNWKGNEGDDTMWTAYGWTGHSFLYGN